ncbi:MAG: HAMP domain-containing sensor histidine kinase [Candidatus Zixiibacteriota bacterium]
MLRFEITPKRALVLFIAMTVTLVALAVWWIVFMARLVDEKVQMAIELGATQEFVDHIHEQEIGRQIMVGLEGLFMLVLVGFGAWLIYRALVRADELKYQQQNFLMAVTHELKTPLASMKIYLDSLESTKIPQDKKASIVPRLKMDANRLEKLVENVLEAGRFERSGFHLSREIFNFSKLVDECIATLSKYPSETAVTVRRGSFDERVMVYGDRSALKRAIDAVMENSVKYNDKDSIEVDVSLKRNDGKACLQISDNGVGLSRKDAARVFERFFRAEADINHSVPGSGLGLYLCREIVVAHGGRIAVHSEGPGSGARFDIELKVETSDEKNTAR